MVEGLIRYTRRLLYLIENQSFKHFSSSSIVYIIGNEPEPRYQVKLIDFRRVVDSNGTPDTSKGYIDTLEGLTNVVAIWERLLGN